jgi:hypothetical protein
VAFFTSRKVHAMEELTWVFLKGFDVSGFMRNVSRYGCGFWILLVSGLGNRA